MGSQITLTMSLVFIALFVIAIFGFAIGFADDNDVPTNLSINYDSQVNSIYSDMEDDINNLDEESGDTYKSILEPLEPGSEVAQSPGRFSGSISDLKNVAKNAIFIPYRTIFGSGKGFGVFFTIFGSIIVLLFGLYLYKTLRGNP